MEVIVKLPADPELCFLWVNRWGYFSDPWWACMNSANWAYWVQAVGSILALWFSLRALRREITKDRLLRNEQAKAQADQLAREARRHAAQVNLRRLEHQQQRLRQAIDHDQMVLNATKSIEEALLLGSTQQWPMSLPPITEADAEDYRRQLTAIETATPSVPVTLDVLDLRLLLKRVIVEQSELKSKDERANWSLKALQGVKKPWMNANARIAAATAELEAVDSKITAELRLLT